MVNGAPPRNNIILESNCDSRSTPEFTARMSFTEGPSSNLPALKQTDPPVKKLHAMPTESKHRYRRLRKRSQPHPVNFSELPANHNHQQTIVPISEGTSKETQVERNRRERRVLPTSKASSSIKTPTHRRYRGHVCT
jgi:hypothetical protein